LEINSDIERVGGRRVHDKNYIMMALMKNIEPAGKRRDSRPRSATL
jgi:hypothetical protein